MWGGGNNRRSGYPVVAGPEHRELYPGFLSMCYSLGPTLPEWRHARHQTRQFPFLEGRAVTRRVTQSCDVLCHREECWRAQSRVDRHNQTYTTARIEGAY